MSDLMKRLGRVATEDDLRNEITRLTAENERLTTERDWQYDQNAEQVVRIAAAEARVARLEGALLFYANGENWCNPFGMSSIIYEGGKIARAALTQPTPEKTEVLMADETPHRWIDGRLRQHHPLDDGVPIPGHARNPPVECVGPCAVCDENQARKALETDTLEGFRAALTQPTKGGE